VILDDGGSIDGSTLCTQCGLCCQGVLDERGRLKEGEAEPLAALGMQIENSRGFMTFALPCPKVEGTTCTIYEQRPATCAGYKSALQKLCCWRD
jgi:Fe-S-cluster containining protein